MPGARFHVSSYSFCEHYFSCVGKEYRDFCFWSGVVRWGVSYFRTPDLNPTIPEYNY